MTAVASCLCPLGAEILELISQQRHLAAVLFKNGEGQEH